MKRNFLFSLSFTLALCGAAAPTWAQGREDRGNREERSREDRGNREDRGGGGEDRGGRRGFDPTDFLRRMDANGNGMIDPDEASGRSKDFVDRMASRAGLDPKQPLSIEKLAGASQSGGEERRGDSRKEEEKPKPSVITSSAAAKVAGFGVSTTTTTPAGFGAATVEKTSRYKRPLEERFEKKVIDRVDEMLKQYDDDKNGAIDYKTDEKKDVRWSTPPEDSDMNKDGKLDREELCYRIAKMLGSKEKDGKDSKGGGSSENNEQRQKVRRYAEGLMKQYDENKNGFLEKEEWTKMSGDPKRADRNEDGIVTLDELADRLGAYGSDNGSSQTASNDRGGGRFGSGGGGGESRDRERGERGGERGGGGGFGGDRGGLRPRGDREASSEKKPIRVLTPTERLPKGLPSWFTRNDADADGQVSMAEYSTSYNDTTAAEFAKYDLDGDGIITPQECLQGEKTKSSSSSSGSGSGSSGSSRYGGRQ